jgi:Putative carbonic anhydrase
MTKRFHFDSPAGWYRADAAVVWCFDDRLTTVVQKFLKRNGIARSDSIRVAGGPKALASPDDEQERTFLLQQLRLSRKLHATDRVILIAHSDCLAWGGLARFQGDAVAEREHHSQQLARAAAVVQSALPEMRVECLFVNFEGVWETDGAVSTGAD